ncbi:MAG: hypothetical protein ACJ8LG_03505 [Massilia sp.]
MSDAEREILKIYDGSRPNEEDLFETSTVNQLAWTLVVLFAGVVIWLCIALVNAENQRYALVANKCPDPVFKGAIDQQCLAGVHSREHWWQHLSYAITHVMPSVPEAPAPVRRK